MRKSLAQGLWLILSLGYSVSVEAYPLHRLLGPSKPAYVQEYLKRMTTWYSQEFGEITEGMPQVEKDLLEYCHKSISDWGRAVSDRFLYRSFWFSHSVKNEQVRHRRFFCAINSKDPKALALTDKLFRQEGFRALLPMEKLWGLVFDRDKGTLEVQWFIKAEDLMAKRLRSVVNKSGQLESSALSTLSDYKSTGIVEPLIYREIYRDHQMIDMGVTVPILDRPSTISAKVPFGFAIIGGTRNIFLHSESYDELQLKSFSLYYLSDLGKFIALKHQKEFNQLTLFMRWTSEKDYELFYP